MLNRRGSRSVQGGVSRHLTSSHGSGSVSSRVQFPKLSSFHGRRLHDRWPRQGPWKGFADLQVLPNSQNFGFGISASSLEIQGCVGVATTKSHETEVSADVLSCWCRPAMLEVPVAVRICATEPFPVAHWSPRHW